MKSFLTLAAICLLAAAPVLRAETLPPEDQYFDIYSLILKGDRLVEKGREQAARTNYLEAVTELKKFQEDFPLWNTKVVKYRLEYLTTKLTPAEPSTAPGTSRAPGHLVSSMSSAADDGKPVELKLKWQTGKRYEQQMDMTMDTDITIPGQSQTMQQKMKMGESFAISVLKDRDDGGHELEMRMTGITMNMDMGGRTLMSFDSKNPSGDAGANPAAAMLQQVAGMHFKMSADANGKVESVEGLKEFLDNMGTAGGADALKGMFSEDSIKEMASFQGLPDHPVKVGDTWPFKHEIPLPALGTMVLDMTYTFTGWEQRDNHKCAVLSFNGNIYTKSGNDGTPAGMVSMDDGKTSGEVLFDVAMGMPVETSAIQSFTMKMSAQGQAMSTKMTQDLSIKLAGVTDIQQ